MKIHIAYEITDLPWGGGNQFLRALRNFFEARGLRADRAESADVVVFNGHHQLKDVIRLRRRLPRAVFVHRMDGILATQRALGLPLDQLVHRVNDKVADATIFQSQWSRALSHEMGMAMKPFEVVIPNAADPAFFFPPKQTVGSARVKLIAASHSSNAKKGFELYSFLDRNLDFSRFEMSFVGNSPVAFRNIRHIAPVPSRDLGSLFRAHDIFITASQDDACSNALIEAMACGLPVAVLNSGGHPELVGPRGLLFDDPDGALGALDRLSRELERFRGAEGHDGFDVVGGKYLDFFEFLLEKYRIGKVTSLNMLEYGVLYCAITGVKRRQKSLRKRLSNGAIMPEGWPK